MTQIEYSICPEGKKDWYYRLFGKCFSKLYIDSYDKKYRHKVLWFSYTTDGKQCKGLYSKPDEDYPPEAELYRPDCLFFCALSLRFIRKYIFCNKE